MFKWKSLTDHDIERIVPGVITSEEVAQARDFWIKFEQSKEESELHKSVSQGDGEKVHGRYKRLALFKDKLGIWRVGLRMKEYTPFTADKRPPAFLPKYSRLTQLLMEQAHRLKHSGVDETVTRFRLMGYWTTEAMKIAKAIKSRCVTCRILDKQPVNQLMGSIPQEQTLSPVAWGDVELDLFGPFKCRSDVNKRASIKVWGLVVVDKASGGVHCDILMDYSAQETLKTLRRFASLRGWPARISSDPGSQLVSSAGNIQSWWSQMGTELSNLAAGKGFKWDLSPANSPWRQGRTECRIKTLK